MRSHLLVVALTGGADRWLVDGCCFWQKRSGVSARLLTVLTHLHSNKTTCSVFSWVLHSKMAASTVFVKSASSKLKPPSWSLELPRLNWSIVSVHLVALMCPCLMASADSLWEFNVMLQQLTERYSVHMLWDLCSAGFIVGWISAVSPWTPIAPQ